MDAQEFVGQLKGQYLVYGIKSPDMDLYDFGFSKSIGENFDGNGADLREHIKSISENFVGNRADLCKYILHAICRFKVIWQNELRSVERYDEDTPHDVFQIKISRLLGLKVERIGLSEKNDLWLDFGICWVVFATHVHEEESWWLFIRGGKGPFLTVSDTSMYLLE